MKTSNPIIKILSILISVSFLFTTTLAFAGIVGDTYNFYPEGILQSITYSTPKDNVKYEEYLDEELYGWGYMWRRNPFGYSSRIWRQVLYSPDVARDDALSVKYDHSMGLMKADLNGDEDEDIIAEWGSGIYAYYGAGWNKLHTVTPDSSFIANLNADATDELIAEWGTGLYSYSSGSGWTKIHPVTPNSSFVANINGGGDDIIAEWGSALYSYSSGSGWTKLHPAAPDSSFVTDLNADGTDEIIAEWGTGLYSYSSGSGWTKIHPVTPNSSFVADINGGGDDIIAEWGGALYSYSSGSGWTKLHPVTPDSFFVADLNADGTDEIIAEWGGPLYRYSSGSGWAQIHPSIPNSSFVADINGGGDDIIAEWGGALYSYSSGSGWSKIHSLTPNFVTTEYAYSDDNYQNLIYTATYDSAGTQLSKEYNNQSEYYDSDLLKRYIEGATGNVFEYDDQDTYNEGQWGSGRPLVESSHTTTALVSGLYTADEWYKVYSWGDYTTGIGLYAGEYNCAIDADVKADVGDSELRSFTVYLHNGDYTDDTAIPQASWQKLAYGIYDLDGEGDENLIEAYQWYAGGGNDPTPEYLMKSYNAASYSATEWESPPEHRVITEASYTTQSIEGGVYTSVPSSYKTYDWGEDDVVVDMYAGHYTVTSDYTTRTDIVGSELRASYTYLHNDNYNTYNNEDWIMESGTIYDEDGVTPLIDMSYYTEPGSAVRNLLKRRTTYGTDGCEWGWQEVLVPTVDFEPGVGDPDYIDCGHDASLDIEKDITLEAWIKTSSYTTGKELIIDKFHHGDGPEEYEYDGFALGISEGSLVFYTKFRMYGDWGSHWNGSTWEEVRSNDTVNDDEWHHVAVTMDTYDSIASGDPSVPWYNTTVTYYVDGLVSGSYTTWTPGDRNFSDLDLHIGGTSRDLDPDPPLGDTYQGFDGQIRYTAIYDRSLTSNEIVERYSDQPVLDGLVASWNYDALEYGGSTLGDDAGSNDGTLQGDASWEWEMSDDIYQQFLYYSYTPQELYTGYWADNSYQTFYRGGDYTSQVSVSMYDGLYEPSMDDPLRSEVDVFEKVVGYVFDHNNSYTVYGNETNVQDDWVMREQGIYTSITYNTNSADYSTETNSGGIEVLGDALIAGSGVYTNCASFDGDGDYVTVDASWKWIFDIDDCLTIDFWLKRTDDCSSKATIMSSESVYDNFSMECDSDEFVLYINGNYHTWNMEPDTIVQNEWNHIALVIEDGIAKGFINGEYSSAMDWDLTGYENDIVDVGSFHLGRRPGGVNELQGCLDDFRISDSPRWDEAFTTVGWTGWETDDSTLFLMDFNSGFSSTTMDAVEQYEYDEETRLTHEFIAVNDSLKYFEYFVGEHSDLYSYQEIYTVSDQELDFAYWYQEDEDHRVKYKYEEDTDISMEFFDAGQLEGGGYYGKTQWVGDYTIIGYVADYTNHPYTMLWGQADTPLVPGEAIDGMEVYEYHSGEYSNNIHWKDLYGWDSELTSWVYTTSAEYSTDGVTLLHGGYTTRTPTYGPGENGIPENRPAKPEPEYSGLLALEEYILSESTVLSADMRAFFDKIVELREKSAGVGVLVALLDSGINLGEVDSNIAGGYDFAGDSRWSDDNDADYSDPTGHGTETAEVISATASGADLLIAKVTDAIGKTTNSILSDAIKWAVDQGARVLAMPLSLMPVNSLVADAIDYALNKGAILVTSAGNDGADIEDESLAAQEGVITVGSVDNDGMLSAWSNTGEEVDLYAPWDIIGNKAGTSLSAAFVAGITALILEDDPSMDAGDVLKELEKLFGTITEGPEIKGADLDEIISKYEAIRKSRADATGNPIVEEYVEGVTQ